MAIKQQQIEKKSLEAHVDLCAERYNELNKNIKTMEVRIDSLSSHVLGLKEDMNKIVSRINSRIITIAGATLGIMTTAVIALTLKLIDVITNTPAL